MMQSSSQKVLTVALLVSLLVPVELIRLLATNDGNIHLGGDNSNLQGSHE
jgi:hypothetical protein